MKKNRQKLENCLKNYLNISNYIKIQISLDHLNDLILKDDIIRNLLHNLSNILLVEKNIYDSSIINLKNEIESILIGSNKYDVRISELVKGLFN